MTIKSMTGYGGAKGSCAGLNISIELKSVNNRYLDCSVRLPRNFLFAEEAIKSRVQSHISRGKVDVFVTVESAGTDEVIVKVNEPLARGYADAIAQIADKLGLGGELNAFAISRMPDVLSMEKPEMDAEALTAALTEIAEQALCEFDKMREREGKKLQDDIEARLGVILSYVGFVEQRSPATVAVYREKLWKKMSEVLESRRSMSSAFCLRPAFMPTRLPWMRKRSVCVAMLPRWKTS